MKFLKFIILARRRFLDGNKKNNIHYINFQKFQAEEIINELRNRGINLSSMRVLELGSGKGGYSLVFKKYAKELIISDFKKSEISGLNHRLKFKRVDVNKRYPFKDNSFDLVFSCSLIEHVENPDNMLSEIKRVLKPNRYLYLSFPPFYSPVGGHGLKPFHLLGEKNSIRIINVLKGRNIKSYKTLWINYGLYKRTIKQVKRLLFKKSFEIKDIWTRFFPINTAKIPIINEFLTWHVCFLCKNKK